MTTLLEAAEATRLKLKDLGYSPIPVNGKKPLIKGWTELGDISAQELSRLTLRSLITPIPACSRRECPCWTSTLRTQRQPMRSSN
jgi:hypothetical protein